MPRIDPIQLLNCLSVLLSPNGGIKSQDEVQRIAHLMGKFSKKLVSKCIYIQILKCTETELLGLFMVSGGWNLIHTWLTECIVSKNWPLVRELLELFLLCPVDLDRLKTNNCPKLVKELSKDESHYAISALASKLVEQWLKSVKGEYVVQIKMTDIKQIISDAKFKKDSENNVGHMGEKDKKNEKSNLDESDKNTNTKVEENNLENNADSSDENTEMNLSVNKDKESETLPVFKISVKDGKQVISQVDDGENKTVTNSTEKEKNKDKYKSKHKDKSYERTSSSKSSSSTSKHSSKSHTSSSDKSRSSHRSSSSSKEKDRHRDKDKHSSHKSSISKSDDKPKSSSSSSKSKEDKRSSRSEKDKSKDKSNKDEKCKDMSTKASKSDEKPVSPSIHKLGKIPKLSDSKKEKPSISIEVRKPDEPKPKTVKTFHSKFRKHGLEEEIKPPPSRASLLNKKSPSVIPPTLPVAKRLSPVHSESPPEKKPKTVENVEKPGAIKLIPPKPKPMLLLESDMFMDALNASATNKKEPKKRKRRTSGSKDGSTTGDGSPPHTPTTITSPSTEKSVPPRFYQDTLETEDKDGKENNKKKVTENSKENETPEPMETEPHTLTINGLKGVLCYHKRKGPKKSIKWKPDNELEEIKFFELDETERVNVTKTFTDMKHLERINEREAFEKARNLINDDVMEEKTSWKPLILVDGGGQILVEHGKNSKEKEIQAIRQKGTLQPLYFHKSMIPDSPLEAEPETHPYTDPTTIPLEDVTGNQDNISDFRNMPWPEPKGNAPPSSSNINLPTIFPSNMTHFPPGFPNAPFPGVPGFQAPAMISGEWPNGVAPIMPNGMPGPMPPPGIPPGALPNNIPPGMIVPPENMMMNPEMFVGPNPMFPVPDGFNMAQNMFPIDFNMAGPQGPPGPDGFPGSGNFRGAMRGRGSNGHWRGKGGGNWDNPQRGRGGNSRGGRKAMCIYFQRKGSCRQGDNCSFLHPGVNCPY